MRAMSSPMVTACDPISCPRVIGTASCICVRPIFTTCENSTSLDSNAVLSSAIATVRSSIFVYNARRIAVGYTSLVDCERFTWSLGWQEVYSPRSLPR